MAGRCGAGAGWNAGAAGRAIAGAAGRATAAGAAPRLGCCAEAPMHPATREKLTKEAAKDSAKPTLSGSMVVGSLSYPAPHASITRERGKRSAHERRARITAALQDRLVRTPRLIAIAQVHDVDCDQGHVHSGHSRGFDPQPLTSDLPSSTDITGQVGPVCAAKSGHRQPLHLTICRRLPPMSA
jgi:hypothetical protein